MIRSEGEATSAATDAFVELDLEPVMLAVGSLAHRIAGHLDEARAIAAAGHRRYLEESNGPAQGLFALALGQVELPAGRIAQADALFREAVALLRRPPALYLVWALGCLSQTASILGQVDAATESLAEAEEQRSATFQVFDCDVRLGQAWRAAATGDLSTARQIALESADSAAGAGQYGFAAVAAHDAARLGAPANASHLLDDLLRRTDSLAIEAFAEHARALAQEDIDALLDVAGRFDRLGCRLYAAEAYAEAASRLEDAGRAGAADRSGTRARSLLEECGDVRTPALARLDRTPMLTEREEEVARLALSGLTNRAIAARLQISVRTVDNHLHHAYEKLAVSGRDELGTVLK
jgi:DNA-binding CsgD family transcriptional regulator